MCRAWPPMIWIGGMPGAGKSTLARRLAHDHDLPLHPIDRWTYVHNRRMWLGNLDDELAQGSAVTADAFVDSAYRRLEFVVEDVRSRTVGSVATVVEGPQLWPHMAAPLPEGHAAWLVSHPDRTRLARESRLALAEVAADRARLDSLIRRDAELADRLRAQAAEAGVPIIEVPVEPDWDAVAAAATDAVAAALQAADRLLPGDDLALQRQLENRAACVQGRLWQDDVGLAELPPFPFACECGSTGCAATWPGTPDRYDAETTDGRLIVDHC